jgi:hypothetical protein
VINFEMPSDKKPAARFAAINAAIERMRKTGLGDRFNSAMLTFDEVEDLINRLDARTLEVVKEIARADGGIALSRVAKIYGVEPDKYLQLHSAWLGPLNGLVKTLVGETCRPLIFSADNGPVGSAPKMGGFKYKIEGPALWMLQAALCPVLLVRRFRIRERTNVEMRRRTPHS